MKGYIIKSSLFFFTGSFNFNKTSNPKTVRNLSLQECLPVGCVPPTLYRPEWGLCPGGLCLRGLCPGRGLCQGEPPDRDPPVYRMTDMSKNITLPQTSFAGGKNVRIQILLRFH